VDQSRSVFDEEGVTLEDGPSRYGRAAREGLGKRSEWIAEYSVKLPVIVIAVVVLEQPSIGLRRRISAWLMKKKTFQPRTVLAP
jgi:hypothetical protein